MERRLFIKRCSVMCAGGLALNFLMESCGSIHYAQNSLSENKIKVLKSEFLDSKNKPREFIVLKNEKLNFPICLYFFKKEYVALYMECTHQGCELQPNKTSLVCPCHGSEFSKHGKVLNPPADKDLKQFKVITDNENIFVEI